jgi:hypothetical protein
MAGLSELAEVMRISIMAVLKHLKTATRNRLSG